jgi:hypothetical protein
LKKVACLAEIGFQAELGELLEHFGDRRTEDRRAMGKVLGIVYRAISTHLIHKAGYQLKVGATGAVTLIQRFGS